MKILSIFLCAMCLTHFSTGQTSIFARVGVDIARFPLENNALGSNFNNNFVNESVFGGFAVDKKIKSKISLNAQTSFSHKKIKYTSGGNINYDNIQFLFFQQGLTINRSINSKYTVGAGSGINLMFNIINKHDVIGTRSLTRILYDYGLQLNFNHHWKRYIISGYFYQGVKKNFVPRELLTMGLNSSFGIAFQYKLIEF